MAEMNSSAAAILHASMHSSSVASSFPQRRLSRMVPENRVLFWRTFATLPRSTVMSYSLTSTPPILTVPDETS